MQRKIVFAYLLFSLFLFFLLSSCFAPSSSELSKLSSAGKYEELEKRTATILSKSIDAQALFYRGVALQGLHLNEDALYVLNLYFAIAKEDDLYIERAHRLMCTLALKANEPGKSIASARWLENRAILQEAEARAYYQSLLALGESTEATRVFSSYLKNSISPYAYAEMLLFSSPEKEEIAQAFSILSQQEQLALLQKVASDIVTDERALFLLSLATPLEQAFDGSALLFEVYRLLETLYGYANLRVQGRKYNSLVTNF